MQKMVITNEGQNLLAKLIANEEVINFSKVCTSSKDYSNENLEQLTEIEIKQEVEPYRVYAKDDKSVIVSSRFDNTDITLGYNIMLIGLYAKDNSDKEILYAVAIADDMPDFLGSIDDCVSGFSYELITMIGNADNVILEVNPSGFASIDDLVNLEREIEDLEITVETNITNLEQRVNGIDYRVEALESDSSSSDGIGEINNKIGIESDEDVTATLFGRIKQTYNYLVNTINAKIGEVNSSTNDKNTIFNYLYRLETIITANRTSTSSIKSIQRGVYSFSKNDSSTVSISISSVTTSKCMVILDNSIVSKVKDGYGNQTLDYTVVYLSQLKSLTSTSLSVSKNYAYGDEYTSYGSISWQVIQYR